MVRSSQVSLIIGCDPAEAAAITAHLGIQPSEVVESRLIVHGQDGRDKHRCIWTLHSPMPADQGDAVQRLWALVEAIRPSGDRFVSLDSRWHPGINIVYQVTPSHPNSITGEFDWFHMPTKLVKVLAEWGLSVSYETIWFDHLDSRPARLPWWRRLRRPL